MKSKLVIVLILFSVLLQATKFDIEKFTNPEKYGWKTPEQQKNFRKNLLARKKTLLEYNEKAQSPYQNMLKSAIAPGWGHFAAEHQTRGQIFLGMQILLFGTSLYFYDQSNEYYSKYKSATQIDKMNQYYNDAQTPYRYAQIFTALWIITWVYTVYDTVTATENYNKGLWNDLMEKNNIQITPKGIEIRF